MTGRKERKRPTPKSQRWRWSKKVVTIELPMDFALYLGEHLNDWESWTPWVDREDCQGWKRSAIARENRRESITLGNCLGTIMCALGRQQVRKLMDIAKDSKAVAEVFTS